MELPDYVLAVLGMPSSIYGAVQFWEWIAKPRDKPETSELQVAAPTVASASRVLLEFDKNNMSKPGTWEYGIASFYRRLPRHYRGQGVARPVSLLNRPPGSKIRRILPGWLTSKRGNGSRYGTTPLYFISYSVGGGTVCNRCGVPFME